MRRYLFLLIAISLLLAQTLPTIISGRFTFAFDMGRDLLWVRNMVELKKPTLIGPWGSIAGVYFGPLWYYLLAIPYVIFNGDPRAAVAVPLAANLLTILIGWIFLRRHKHPVAADVFALLYSVSPMIVSLSSFAFHANLLPLTTLLFIIGLYKGPALPSARPGLIKQLTGLPLAALSASLAYHLEPAAGVMLTIFLIVYKGPALLKTRPGLIKTIAISAILFLIPFIPQVIFEFRHNFVETKSLISYFQGENTSLGGVLPLSERIGERAIKLSDTLSYSLLSVEPTLIKLVLMTIFILLLILLSVIPAKAGIYLDRFRVPPALSVRLQELFVHGSRGAFRRAGKPGMTRNVLHFTIYFLLFHYFTYVFFFPAELKNWYLFGFSALFILSVSLIIGKIFADRKIVLVVIVAAFILWNTEVFAKLIPKNISPAAPETLTAQLEVVDWIYQDALKTSAPFSVYTYTPPIYDYTYQYLIWWRGAKRYGKLPAEFSYLPEETSYLPEKEKFVSVGWKPQDGKTVYLIIEPDNMQSRQQGWLGHFAAWPKISEISFPSGIKIETRSIIN